MLKLVTISTLLVAVFAQHQPEPFSGFQIGVVDLNGQRYGQANTAATFANSPVFYKNGFFAAPISSRPSAALSTQNIRPQVLATSAPVKLVRPSTDLLAPVIVQSAPVKLVRPQRPKAIRAPHNTFNQAPIVQQLKSTRTPQTHFTQAPGTARIISQVHAAQPTSGAFRFHYQTENGIHAQEINTPRESANAVRGTYSYVAPDGQLVAVSYIADENGFRPQIHGDQGARLVAGVEPLPASVRLPTTSL